MSDPDLATFTAAANAGFKRVSFKLVLMGTVCDLLYAILWMLSVLPAGPEDNTLCIAAMFGQNIFLLASLFCTASIGINLLLVFVFEVRPDRPYEKVYYSVSVLVAVLFPVIAVSLGWYGWNGTECWYTVSPDLDGNDKASTVHEWLTYYVWVLLVSAFCLICTIAFHFSMLRRRNRAGEIRHPTASVTPGSASTPPSTNAFKKTEGLIRRVVGRVRWYCLTPILAQMWSLASDLNNYQNLRLLVAANFFSGAMVSSVGVHNSIVLHSLNVHISHVPLFSVRQGAFNSTVFLFLDPSFQTARSKLRVHLVYTHYFRHFRAGTSPPTIQSSSSIDPALTSRPVDSHGPPSANAGNATGLRSQYSQEEGRALLVLKDPSERKPLAYHLVRTLLLTDEDVTRFTSIAKQASKRNSQSPNAVATETGGSTDSAGAERALQDSQLAGSTVDEAADELNRL
ncbi:hypothetical protein HKX48_006081 [Thoreauomyces humboldtii]|nr:hypothetical protein HKX48_006081 [Thoreauomyces humboldtii]